MSFRIHAHGTPGFTYDRDNCIDDGDFDQASLIISVGTAGPSVSQMAWAAIESQIPNEGSARQAGVLGIARNEMVHLLRDQITMLAAHPLARQGQITVYSRLERTLWANTCRVMNFTTDAGQRTARYFFEDLCPILEATEMNNFGVLRQLAMVFARYQRHLRNRQVPRILIQLFR